MIARFAPGVGTAYVGDASLVLLAEREVDARVCAAVDRAVDHPELAGIVAARRHAAVVSFQRDDAALLLTWRGPIASAVDDRPVPTSAGDGWQHHRQLVDSDGSTTVTVGLDRHALPFAGQHRLDVGVVPAAAVSASFGPVSDVPHQLDALLCPTTVTGGEPSRGTTKVQRALGVLVFSSGERFLVDKPMVLGRNPHPSRRLVGDDAIEPRLVRLTGRGLSRQHAIVRLDGRHPTIDDLGSANGTMVSRPDGPPRRVTPGAPVTLSSGSLVDLGGAVSFVVEDVA